MATSGTGAGSLQLTVALAKPTATTQLLTVLATTTFGDRVTAITFYAVGATVLAVTDNRDGTFTVARPANVVGGPGDAVYTVVASATGYSSVSKQVTVAQQAAVPATAPQLTATVATGTVNYVLTYTDVGTSITYTKDAVAQGAVPASPWTIARAAADHIYVITVTGADGTTLAPYTFTVPATPQTDPGAPPGTSVGAFGFANQATLDALLLLAARLRVIAVNHGDMA